MIRGLYQRGTREQRLLAIDQIATLCRVSPKKIRQWMSRHGSLPAAQGGQQVELGALLSFLIGHNMPVPASLLPQKTIKILFVVTSGKVADDKEMLIDGVCRLLLAEHSPLLIETSILSRATHLTILTFCPDLAVVFSSDPGASERVDGIVKLLSGMPATKTLVFADNASALAADNPQRLSPAALFNEKDLSGNCLSERIREFFTS